MTLHISTWVWGSKYGPEYIERLRAGVARNMQSEYRWHVFSPEPEDEYLTEIPGCFCRLRAFDPVWQERHGIARGDRLVCMDLDAVVTGPLDDLFVRTEEFCILSGANSSNPCRFNGSVWMLRGGYRHDVWTDFSLENVKQSKAYEFHDDQGWFDFKFPNLVGWKVGPQSGIYAFQKPAWPKGNDLPKDARLVVFPGWRDPAKFAHLEWIKRNWQ
jgi:hypothetical protein